MKTTTQANPRTEGAPRSAKDGPSYAWMAFFNAYNLSLFVGGATLAVVLGNLPLAGAVAAFELLWLVHAPGSAFLRRVWFDKASEAAREADATARIAERMTDLSPADQTRARSLAMLKARLVGQAEANPSLSSNLALDELERIDLLLADFVELGARAARCERHLAAFDFAALNRSWLVYTRQVDQLGVGDPRREVAEKNAAVLKERRSRYDELVQTLQTTRGQMELVENTLSLLGDDVVTMVNASDIGSRLDELRIAMDAVREVHTGGDYTEEVPSAPRLRSLG